MLYPKDKSIEIDRTPERVTYRWRRKGGDGWGFIAMGAMFYLLSIPVIVEPGRNGQTISTAGAIGFLAFISLVAAPMIYYGLAALSNTWVLTATRERVLRTVGPIWWGSPVDLDASGVKQFFVKSGTSPKSGVVLRGSIYMLDRDDHAHLLVPGLPTTFASYQVCHELQDFYGLEDLPVYGVTTSPDHPGPR